MQVRVNSFALRETTWGSASLGVLGSIAHPVPEDGEYLGQVFFDKVEIGRFRLSVCGENDEKQVDVDLSAFRSFRRRMGGIHSVEEYHLAKGGYLFFFVSEGANGYRVQLSKVVKSKPEKFFDSSSLCHGDLFVLSLIQPGEYELASNQASNKARIKVGAPELGKLPLSPKDPLTIRAGKAIDPKESDLAALQGLVVSVESKDTELVIRLTKPVSRRGSTKVRWNNPLDPS